VERDGAIRLGLRYVSGLRQEVGKKIGAPANLKRTPSGSTGVVPAFRPAVICPKCGCDDPSMIEQSDNSDRERRPGLRPPASSLYFCNNCSHDWAAVASAAVPTPVGRPAPRYRSLDELIARTGIRRDEVVTLADIGALNSFGYDRRSALWQAERAVRPAGELFPPSLEWDDTELRRDRLESLADPEPLAPDPQPPAPDPCPLRPMTESERLVADYAGTGLTVGRHPMALRRDELAMRGVLRAIDLRTERNGRRVRVAGMVITRQRPGTAKGFVFLTLEDETGIANIIVRPDLFARDRLVVVEERFLLVDGVLQHQDGVVSVRAEAVQGMTNAAIEFDAHDFY
jgi:hypothetical protein